MEPRSNIEKPKDRKVKRQKNQKTEDMEIIEIKKDQQQYISEIAALESDIFPDPWSEKSIRDTLENPQARIWAIISRQSAAMLLRFNGAGACKRDCGFLRFNIAGACRQATTPWLCDFLLCVR